MGKVIVNSTTLENIANAIRSKTNSNEKLTPSQMATTISGITGGTTTGDVYISSFQPLRYELVNADPDNQGLYISASTAIDSNSKLIYVKINYSIYSSAGYAVGIVSKSYNIAENTCTLSLSAPTLVADLNEQGYVVIYSDGNGYYLDYNKTQSTGSLLNGKICLLKAQGSESVRINYSGGDSYALTELYIPELTQVTYSDDFDNISSSTMFTLHLPNVSTIGQYSFDISKLKTIILNNIENIEYDAFFRCSDLTTIVIKNPNQVCTLNDVFEETSLSKIYVPDALFESYKSDTNWSWYYNNNYLYPLSEYVEE